MSHQDLLNDLRNRVTESSIFVEALSQLRPGTEISVILGHKHQTALFYDGKQVQLEDRAATAADVEFSLSTDAIALLQTTPMTDMTEFGIAITKLILNKEIKVTILTSSWQIFNKGYLKILTAGGPDFMRFLAEHGLRNLSKVMKAIRSMRK